MPEREADNLMVDMAAYEMKDKLNRKRIEGRSGWFGPNCDSKRLLAMLREHLEKGDMVDVLNLAAMLLAREKLYGEKP